jgi:hypothetical protein
MRTNIVRITALTAPLAIAAALFVASAAPVLAVAGNCPQVDSATGTSCAPGYFWGSTCHAGDLSCPSVVGDPRTVPSCGAGTCNCPSGSYCGTPATPNYNTCVTVQSCPAGQTFNVCTGACVGDITAVIHDYTAAPQASQGTASGSLRIVGSMRAADFCTTGGTCLSTGGGGGWSQVGGTGPDIFFNAGKAVLGAANTSLSYLVAETIPAATLSILDDQATPSTRGAGLEIFKDGAAYDTDDDEYYNMGAMINVTDAGTVSSQIGLGAGVEGGAQAVGVNASAYSEEGIGISANGSGNSWAAGGSFYGYSTNGEGYGIWAYGNKNYLSRFTGIEDQSPRAFLSVGGDGSADTNPGLTGGLFQVKGGSFMNFNGGVSGNVPTFAASGFQRTTLTGWTPGMSTTDAATVYIANAPLAGSNMSITNPWALWVDDGNVRLDGGLRITTGAAAGRVLTSDASGNATWQATAGGLSMGTTVTSGTTGSVLFVGASSALTQDNANLFWDDTNNRLGIGDATPDAILDALSNGAANTTLKIANTNAGDFDPVIGFELAEGTHVYTVGVDDSDADKFKIASGNALGTNDRITIDPNAFNDAVVKVTSPAFGWNATLLGLTMDAASPVNQNNLILTAGLTDGTRYFSIAREGYANFGNIGLNMGNTNSGQNVIYAIADYAGMYSQSGFDDNLILLQTYASGVYTDRFRVNRDGIVVAGGLRIAASAGNGKVLTSDASGNATWQTLSALPSGSANQTLRHNGTAWVANSTLVTGTTDGFGPHAGIDVVGGQNTTFQVNNGAVSGTATVRLTTSYTSGTTDTDGFVMGSEAFTGKAFFNQLESADMSFRMNGTERMAILSAGAVSIPSLTSASITGTGSANLSTLAVDTNVLVADGSTNNVAIGATSAGTNTMLRVQCTSGSGWPQTLCDTATSIDLGTNGTAGNRGTLYGVNAVVLSNPGYSYGTTNVYGGRFSATENNPTNEAGIVKGLVASATNGRTSNWGIDASATSHNTQYSTLYGGRFSANTTSSANHNQPVYGAYGDASGSTTTYGVYGTASSGTSAILSTNAYGGYFTASENSSVGTAYGLYASASATPATFAYALYTAAGRVQIDGDTIPNSATYATGPGSLYVNDVIEANGGIALRGYLTMPNGGAIKVDGAGEQTLSIRNGDDSTDLNDVHVDLNGELSVFSLNASETDTILSVYNPGSGNSVYVEDTASDPSPFVITNAGDVGVGTAAPGGDFEVYAPSAEVRAVSDNSSSPSWRARFYADRGSTARAGGTWIAAGSSGAAWFVGAPYFSGSTTSDIIMGYDSTGASPHDRSNYRFLLSSAGVPRFLGLTSCAGITTNSSGVMACSSDATLKDIHGDFTAGLAALRTIEPKSFSWKEGTDLYDGGVLNYGFIAQNVQEALPEAVTIGADGKLQVGMLPILAASVNAIKELDGRLTLLEDGSASKIDERVSELEDRIDRLERELMELQMRIAQ